MGNGTAQAIKSRIEALKNLPAEQRGNAFYSLEHNADAEALPVLANALQDEDAFIRESALYALDYYDKEPVEAGIIAILAGDEDANVREAAASALASCPANAVPALIAALSDPAAPVREESARSLGRLEAHDAVAALAAALENDDEVDVRAQAAMALGGIGSDGALAPLAAASCDPSPIVRKHAADGLGETRHIQAPSYLVAMLKDADAGVGEWAARALNSITGLGEVRDPEIFEPLCEALHDDNARVRKHVISVLGNLEDKRAMPLLLKALGGEESEIRAAALKAIASIDKMGGLEHLVNTLDDADVYVRRAAAGTLEYIEFYGSLSPAIKQRLFSIVSNPEADYVVRCSLAKAIARDTDAVPVLIRVLQDNNVFVKEAAANALANTRGHQAFEPLLAALDDPEEIVRGASALALAGTGDSAAVPALSEILKTDDSPSVRRRVVWALSFFDHPEVPDLLTQCLQDPDPHVRETAADALQALGSNVPWSVHLGTVHYE
jgi:HEAT repeat protein